MKKTLKQVKQELYNKILDLRSIYRIIDTEVFEDWYENNSNYAEELIRRGDKEEILRILKRKSFSQLRFKARQLGISNWYKLSKANLIMEIEKHAGCL